MNIDPGSNTYIASIAKVREDGNKDNGETEPQEGTVEETETDQTES